MYFWTENWKSTLCGFFQSTRNVVPISLTSRMVKIHHLCFQLIPWKGEGFPFWVLTAGKFSLYTECNTSKKCFLMKWTIKLNKMEEATSSSGYKCFLHFSDPFLSILKLVLNVLEVGTHLCSFFVPSLSPHMPYGVPLSETKAFPLDKAIYTSSITFWKIKTNGLQMFSLIGNEWSYCSFSRSHQVGFWYFDWLNPG